MLLYINYTTSSQLATISAPELGPPAAHELITAPPQQSKPGQDDPLLHPHLPHGPTD